MSPRTTYLTTDVSPLPFCPGCGHMVLLKAIDKAFVKLQPDPAKVVIVTDIGCIGLSDRHFITSAFHGLHGRSLTYACGMKLARPELIVICLMGDGAAGIGGAHLLNAARRNVGVKLIIANNFNFGMTGGQHSVTTPSHGLTSTTPRGNLEGPMDLCGTAIAAGAPWVNRTTIFHKDLVNVIVRAIQAPGFAMIDCWELCTAYYAPRNNLKKKELLGLMGEMGQKPGQLIEVDRSEYSAKYRAYYAAAAPPKFKPKIEPAYQHNIRKQTGILIAGSAGQKIKSAATLFAQGGMYAGLDATQKDDYPVTVMTGHSLAEVILSPEPIDYTAIEKPDYFLLLSDDGAKRAKKAIAALPEGCVLYAEESLDLPPTKARVVRLPFEETARKTNRSSITVVALAAMLVHSGIYPVKAFETAIVNFQKQALAEPDLQALATGVALAAREPQQA